MPETRTAYVQSLPVSKATGEADIDIGAGDYTSYLALLTIAPATNKPLEDVRVIFDLAKATTGFAAGHTTQTVNFRVARKVDGTNWRGGETELGTALTGTLAAGRSIEIVIGSVDPTEDVRIEVVLSAENAVDVEFPYVLYHKGATPTITAVAA